MSALLLGNVITTRGTELTSTDTNLASSHATISLFGDVSAPDFPSWILRHAHKLGVRSAVRFADNCVKVTATGPDVMLEALALGCSLGPATVLVDRVEFELSRSV